MPERERGPTHLELIRELARDLGLELDLKLFALVVSAVAESESPLYQQVQYAPVVVMTTYRSPRMESLGLVEKRKNASCSTW